MIFAADPDLMSTLLQWLTLTGVLFTAARSWFNALRGRKQDATLADQDAKLAEIHEAVAVNATALADHAEKMDEKMDDAARIAASLAARQAVADHAAQQERPRSDFTRP